MVVVVYVLFYLVFKFTRPFINTQFACLVSVFGYLNAVFVNPPLKNGYLETHNNGLSRVSIPVGIHKITGILVYTVIQTDVSIETIV